MDSKQYKAKFLETFGCFGDNIWYNRRPVSSGCESTNAIPARGAFQTVKQGVDWLNTYAEGPWWAYEQYFTAQTLAEEILEFWTALAPTEECKEVPPADS